MRIVKVRPAAPTALLVLLASLSSVGLGSSALGAPQDFYVAAPSPIDLGPDEGPGGLYPSQIDIDWCPGTITDVTVWLEGVTHTAPLDIDVLLVGPGGQNAIVMSDAGGSQDIADLQLRFNDDNSTPLPAASVLSSGAYAPTNHGLGDTFAAPAPTPSGGSALSVFDGTAPSGTWELYVMDDADVDSGAIGFGWTLFITATSPSATHLCFPSGGNAEPFPSTRTISGLAGDIADVDLDIVGFTHRDPSMISLMLVSPGGKDAFVMRGVGANGGPTNLTTFTLDDEALAPLPETTTLLPGSYRPARYYPDYLPADDIFHPPAPQPSGATALSTFDGTDPNGEWRLFATSWGQPPGVIADWSLDITMTPPTIGGKKPKAVEGKPLKFIVSRSGAGMGQTLELPFSVKGKSAKPGKDFAKKKGVLTLGPDQTSAVVKVKTKNDQVPEKKKEKLFLRITLPDGTVLQLPGVIKDND